MKNITDKRSRRARQHYSCKSRKQLVLEYKCGNVSQAEFCRERGINATTFSGWLKKYDEPVFAEVVATAECGSQSHAVSGMELHLPNGIRVTLPSCESTWAAGFIREVARCSD